MQPSSAHLTFLVRAGAQCWLILPATCGVMDSPDWFILAGCKPELAEQTVSFGLSTDLTKTTVAPNPKL